MDYVFFGQDYILEHIYIYNSIRWVLRFFICISAVFFAGCLWILKYLDFLSGFEDGLRDLIGIIIRSDLNVFKAYDYL